MSEKSDFTTFTEMAAEAIDCIQDDKTGGNPYVNYLGVFDHGWLKGFIMTDGVRDFGFQPATEAVVEWWHARPFMDDENP